MTIKEEYRRTRSNYLARARELEKQGYQVERIAPPKKPTKASINRLNKLTSKSLKEKSDLIDFSTGEVVDKTQLTTSTRKSFQQNNKRLHNYAKEIEKEFDSSSKRKAKNKSVREKLTEKLPQAGEIALQNFIEGIENFIPPVQQFIRDRIQELTSTEEKRKALIRAIEENPDYLPTPEDSDVGTISYKFAQLARIMDYNMEQEEFQDLMSMSTGEYEIEE